MLEPSHKLRAEGDDQSFFRLGKPLTDPALNGNNLWHSKTEVCSHISNLFEDLRSWMVGIETAVSWDKKPWRFSMVRASTPCQTWWVLLGVFLGIKVPLKPLKSWMLEITLLVTLRAFGRSVVGGRSNIMGRPNIFNKGYPISGPQHA